MFRPACGVGHGFSLFFVARKKTEAACCIASSFAFWCPVTVAVVVGVAVVAVILVIVVIGDGGVFLLSLSLLVAVVVVVTTITGNPVEADVYANVWRSLEFRWYGAPTPSICVQDKRW